MQETHKCTSCPQSLVIPLKIQSEHICVFYYVQVIHTNIYVLYTVLLIQCVSSLCTLCTASSRHSPGTDLRPAPARRGERRHTEGSGGGTRPPPAGTSAGLNTRASISWTLLYDEGVLSDGSSGASPLSAGTKGTNTNKTLEYKYRSNVKQVTQVFDT